MKIQILIKISKFIKKITLKDLSMRTQRSNVLEVKHFL